MELRNAVISILEGYDNTKEGLKTNISFNIFYNVVPSIIIMIIVSIFCLAKKKFIMPLILGIQLIKTLAIIITAPDCFFMYYLPTYLTGYFIAMVCLIAWLYNRNNKEKVDIMI